jgi:3-oxoadipate enol-lactonase
MADDPGWPAIERGSGTPVVFLHGFPLSHAIWDLQLDPLSLAHHVVVFDMPGYGLARRQPVPVTLREFAERVARAVRERFDAPVVVVGHSFGGYVALEWFRLHPERFAALVLTNTRATPDSPAARALRLATAERLKDPSEHLDVDAVARDMLAPRNGDPAGPLFARVRNIIENVPSRTIIGTLRAMAGRPDLTPILPRVRIPTLVVWGEADRLIPPEQSQAMLATLPSARGVGIPDSGHLPPLEAPETFARSLNEFLDSLSLT